MWIELTISILNSLKLIKSMKKYNHEVMKMQCELKC